MSLLKTKKALRFSMPSLNNFYSEEFNPLLKTSL